MSGIKNRVLAVLLMLAMLLSSLPVLGEEVVTLTPEQIEELVLAEEPAEEAAEEPVAEPTVEEPTVEEPSVEEPTVEEPSEEPTVEEPTVEEPTVEEPSEEPTVEEPTVEEPAVEEPATEEPAEEEAVAEGAAGTASSDFVVVNGILSNYTGKESDVVIPDNMGITTIGANAFNGTGDGITITSVVIPEGVTAINASAFYYCVALESVTLPSTLKKIGTSAFGMCFNLEEINLPVILTEIGSGAFTSCQNLKEISVPSGVKIGDSAFYDCTSLREITLGNGTSLEGNSTFFGCKSLQKITLPSGTKELGRDTFRGCTSLTSVTLPNGLTEIGDNAFTNCIKLENISIPTSVETIGLKSFDYCISLKEIQIPRSVTEISRYAFNDCSKDLVIYVYADSYAETWCEENLINFDLIVDIDFTYTIENGEATITGYTGTASSATIPAVIKKAPVTKIGSEAFAKETVLRSITIPASVKTIGKDAFKDSAITSVTLNTGLTTIEERAFYNCTALKSINLPAGLTTIGDQAFTRCAGLTSITLPAGLTTIGDAAFLDTALTSVSIPASVTSIGHRAFYVPTLTSISVATDSTSYSSVDGVLFNKSKTELITYPIAKSSSAYTVPTGVTTIGANAFMSCASLVSISLPETVTTIETEAFFFCSKLANINLPTSITAIGEAAFLSAGNVIATVEVDSYAHTYCKNNYVTVNLISTSCEHTYGAWTVVTEASCGSEGLEQRTCTKCNWMESKSIPAKEHYHIFVKAVAATCAAPGHDDYEYCPNCNTYFDEKVEIPALPHTFELVLVKAPTCAEAGSSKQVCTVCKGEGETYVEDALPHTFEWVLVKASTCAEAGSSKQVCTVCKGEGETRTEAALPHTEIVLPAVEATYTSTGLTAGKKCTVCGTITVPQQLIPMLEREGFDLEKTGSNGTYKLYIDDTLQLNPVFADEEGWEVKSWKSSSSSKVKVDEDGMITARKEGTATITCTTKNNKKATVKIEVLDPFKPTEIVLNGSGTLKMAPDEEFQLEVEVLPEGLDCDISFKSSKTKYVEVDDDGLITSIKRGDAEITVTAVSESGAKLTKTFKVSVKKAPSKITLDEEEMMVAAGSKPFSIGYSFGSSSYASVLTWYSSDESVATIHPVTGKITPLATGETEITVETANGLSDSCILNVCGEAVEIYVPETDLVMSYKQTHKINAILLDADGNETIGEIEYESDYPKNVSVSSSGKLEVKKSTKGIATITLTSDNGLSEIVTVEVVSAPSKVVLDETSIELEVDDEYLIEPILEDDEAASFTYSSNKKSVATVDADGNVVAVGEGSAKITVKSHNGKKATLKVEVVDPYKPTKITLLDESPVEIYVDEEYDLDYELDPIDATDKVEWKSSTSRYVSVDEDGVVTGLRAGKTVTITVETYNGKKDTIKVKVLSDDE